MDLILVKLLAAFLALSQVMTAPDAIKTRFDPDQDTQQVVDSLRAGCTQMRKAFDIESLDVDGLIETALDDPDAMTVDIKQLRGLKFASLKSVYKQICKNEAIDPAVIDIGQIIAFYNGAAENLPEASRLKGMKLSGTVEVFDGKGNRFAEVFEADSRRVWVPLSDIPVPVQKAFVGAEDKRFYQHKGIDERGLIRAMIANLAKPGRPQGGSTITQQVAKNLLVGDDVSYERKIKEIIVAARMEQVLSKNEILELYLNSIYLGRASWGIEMASRSYFGKSVGALTVPEGVLLAALTKGPNYFNPDRHPERAAERVAYVYARMQEDGVLTQEQVKDFRASPTKLADFTPPRRSLGFAFLDQVAREAKTLPGVDPLPVSSSVVHATVQPALQRAAEGALQEGLAQYEMSMGRTQFRRAEANLTEAIRKIDADPKANKAKPAWNQALTAARLPLYDVHWTPVAVQSLGESGVRVGLPDGRVVALSNAGIARRALRINDVVYAKVTEGKGKAGVRADLRVRPQVQGAAIVLENKTGRVLAMAGGFSYPLSQINRASQTSRQPGSSFKPFTYLAALRTGLQPNTLLRDAPVTLPPIGSRTTLIRDYGYRDSAYREKDYWTPKNYDGGSSGITTMRRALENSKNLVTASMLDGAIDSSPPESLRKVCALTMEAGVVKDCIAYYPFVLGAQPVRLIDMAAFYAAIANEGQKPTPYLIESVDQAGKTVFRRQPVLKTLADGDRVAFYQLRTMLQGVLARGTARQLSYMSTMAGGKTGTSDDENDAWFMGFTNDVTVGVWVGYDNAAGKRRTLGGGQTGGKVAAPIFEQIVNAVWADYAKKTPLPPPSAQIGKQIAALPIDLHSGARLARGQQQVAQAQAVDAYGNPVQARATSNFMEYFRVDRAGQVEDTQYKVVSRDETYSYRGSGGYDDGEGFGGQSSGWGNPNYQSNPFWQQQPQQRGYGWQQQPQQQQQWGGSQQSNPGGLFGAIQGYGQQQQQPQPRAQRGRDAYDGRQSAQPAPPSYPWYDRQRN